MLRIWEDKLYNGQIEIDEYRSLTPAFIFELHSSLPQLHVLPAYHREFGEWGVCGHGYLCKAYLLSCLFLFFSTLVLVNKMKAGRGGGMTDLRYHFP